ncbi:MAG TPA: NAD(P)H-dependent oxidoreductase subunit E [Bryobacteraceae bacterium]|nr:NAD(P)H-dependent oxidoreductase subunit E [Bryobacteraceae bacterium]
MTFSPELETRFEKMIGNYPPGRQKGALIPMLLYAQDEVGRVTDELIEEVSKRLKVKRVEVEEVLGYYTMLHREQRGRHHLQVCTNVSCMLRGGEELFEHACGKLGIGNKQTTADGSISLEEVECIGACSWAPAVMVDYDFRFNLTPEKMDELIESLRPKQ